ncbi:hypothetical protein NLU13_9008 [Sarocladium strictum]|uniref:Uncharacterized protein n=1 Tax=Sarocladium strictum TaxID=5046 RepID=A0AA39GAR2_SARSR|nr:hypothetical protein NLU13_9008 [Sarocladium strictum]
MLFASLLMGLTTLVGVNAAALAPGGDYTSLGARTTDFKCPTQMSYCPWTKACSCSPGQSYDKSKSACVGKKITGAWPKPSLNAHGEVGVKLDAYCAASPTKVCRYDSKHEYCKAGLDTVTFVADAAIGAELDLLAGAEIDLSAGVGISADLKGICAGLSGLYLGNVVDAVALFNTANFGLGAGVKVGGGLFGSIMAQVGGYVGGASCMLGLGGCQRDCVSFCEAGCGNFIDVGGKVGGLISGLAGFCIVDGALKIVNGVGAVVSVTVDGLLCVVGKILTSLLSAFNCNCK